MENDSERVLSNVIKIDDERIKGHLDRIVRGTVEETLNALLDAEADRLVGQDRGHVVGRDERVRKAEAHETAERGACGESERRFEHRDAGAFAADERTRDVEAVLGQQLVEVVAGNPTRDPGKFRANQRREAIADALEPGVDLSLPPACPDDGGGRR